MNHRLRVRQENGYVLLVCLTVVLVTAILVQLLLSFTQATQQAAIKRQYQGRGEGEIEVGLMILRGHVSDQFQQGGYVEVSALSSEAGRTTGSIENGFYDLRLDATSAQPVIDATETHDRLGLLTFPDDPFRGALASIVELDVTAVARRLGQPSPHGNYDFLSLRSTPVLSIRQIPLSQFSLFAQGGGLNVSALVAPSIGRTYVHGDLNISGGTVNASYPVAASGNVNLNEGGRLQAESGPSAQPISLPVESTAQNEWLALARSTQQSTVLTGRDLPMSMIQATPKDELTASPLSVPASPQRDQLRLWHLCSRVIMEASGKITVQGGKPGEENDYRAFKTRIYKTWGPPVIVFDLRRIVPGSGKTSFYVGSTSATAVVLVSNAYELRSDLTIVSPHPILISGGFNVSGAPRTTSLITAQGVFAVP
jgi:hypothetical protein